MCKKHGAVSHSSSEAEVIALEAAVRMEGIPTLMLWELILEVLNGEPTTRSTSSRKSAEGDFEPDIIKILSYVDYVPSNLPISKGKGRLIIFEDNDAVIKMTVKGRSPNMRHVPRTHSVDLDWLFERLRENPGIYIRFVSTKEQIADVFTNGSFMAEQWRHLCRLAQIGTSHDLLRATSGGSDSKSPKEKTSTHVENVSMFSSRCLGSRVIFILLARICLQQRQSRQSRQLPWKPQQRKERR